MKINKSIIITFILSAILMLPSNVYAQDSSLYDITNSSNDKYNISFDILSHGNTISRFTVGDKLYDYTIISHETDKNKPIRKIANWENSNYVIIEGEQTVNIVIVTALDDEVTVSVIINGVKDDTKEINSMDDKEDTTITQTPEQITTPSLTTTSLTLQPNTSYDLNLNDKIQGSTYKWVSSDSKVAKVNDKNGLVTAIKSGQATITCDITTPDSIYSLTSQITVGNDDDNLPILTDTDLNLEVGDVYKVNVENKIQNSSYKWTSSDKSVAKVISSSGKITAISKGTCTITCTITTPDKSVFVLKCEVNIE